MEELAGNRNTSAATIPRKRPLRLVIFAAVPAALIAVLALSAGLGLIHGLLVTKVRLQPFVVTLCGLLIYRGVARWCVRGLRTCRLRYSDRLHPVPVCGR